MSATHSTTPQADQANSFQTSMFAPSEAASSGEQSFDFGGTLIRTVQGDDGEPLFFAADVCKALGIVQVASALRMLPADEKGMRTAHTLGGAQKVSVITEPGLYGLIRQSRKPAAKAFDRWVRHEVLPSIRKTGQYVLAPPIPVIEPPKNQTERRIRDRQIVQHGATHEEAVNHLQEYRDAAPGLRELRSTIDRLVQGAKFGAITGAEYMALFHATSAQLRAALKTDNIRQALPDLEFQTLRTADAMLTRAIKVRGEMTHDEAMQLTHEIIAPLGESLARANAPGKPALPSGKRGPL